MLAMGFSEAISFAFIEDAAAAPFAGGAPADCAGESACPRRSPSCDRACCPGLVDAVGHNRRHGRRDVRLFEIATAFGASGERRSLAAAWTGEAASDHWSGGRREVDFFDVKGVMEQVCAALGATPTFDAASVPYLAPGRAATVSVSGQTAGAFGLLAAAVADARGLPGADAVFVLELNLDVAAPAGSRRGHAGRAAAALPRHRARRVDPRRRHLVCRHRS